MPVSRSDSIIRPARPFSVTLVAAGVLTIASLNLARLVLAIRQWEFLATLPQISPLYQLLTGMIWTSVGFPLVWGLWRGLRWAPGLARSTALAYAAYYWLDLVFLVADPNNNQSPSVSGGLPATWPFTACATLFLLVGLFWILARPKARAYFGEVYG